mgnify:CR=1 FL=1
MDILLHLGTLIAVLIFFRKEIMEIIKALYLGITKKPHDEYDFKIGKYIILGTIIFMMTEKSYGFYVGEWRKVRMSNQ